MSYRPLFSLLVLWPLVQAHAAPGEAACKPNYQVEQTACRESDEVLSYTKVIERDVVVNSGACDTPDLMGMCREFIRTYQARNPKAERIEYSNPTTSKRLDVCGNPLKKLKNKVDVTCDFTYQQPEFRKYSDANCPVVQIADTNTCFATPTPNLDPAAVSDCLSMKVKTTADLWIKGTCLHDIERAALNLDISPADFAQVQSKLAIVRSKVQGNPEYAKLIQILDQK